MLTEQPRFTKEDNVRYNVLMELVAERLKGTPLFTIAHIAKILEHNELHLNAEMLVFLGYLIPQRIGKDKLMFRVTTKTNERIFNLTQQIQRVEDFIDGLHFQLKTALDDRQVASFNKTIASQTRLKRDLTDTRSLLLKL